MNTDYDETDIQIIFQFTPQKTNKNEYKKIMKV